MNDDRITALGQASFEMAAKGSAEYCSRHSFVPNFDALARLLKDVLADTTLRAMADAQEALDCGMSDVAQTGFAIDMRLCGIHAAKFLHVGW